MICSSYMSSLSPLDLPRIQNWTARRERVKPRSETETEDGAEGSAVDKDV